MRGLSYKNHVTDILFTIALFCVFMVSALLVVLFGANVYKSTVNTGDTNYTARTSLTYLSNKVRQNDLLDGVSIQPLNGMDALVLNQEHNGQEYKTWIYFDGGYIKEVFAKSDFPVDRAAGQEITACKDFTARSVEDGLLELAVTDEQGTTHSILVASRCDE